MITKHFTFKSELWLWNEQKGPWYFVTIPKNISQEIRINNPFSGKNFGSVPVTAMIHETHWKTSLFFDSKSACYLLPIKKAIREKLSLEAKDNVNVAIVIEI